MQTCPHKDTTESTKYGTRWASQCRSQLPQCNRGRHDRMQSNACLDACDLSPAALSRKWGAGKKKTLRRPHSLRTTSSKTSVGASEPQSKYIFTRRVLHVRELFLHGSLSKLIRSIGKTLDLHNLYPSACISECLSYSTFVTNYPHRSHCRFAFRSDRDVCFMTKT